MNCIKRNETNENIEIDFADSCIYKKEGIYYQFTSIRSNGEYKLLLYYSSSLLGSYKEHPCNPLVSSDKFGRCGGSIMEFDGKLYRYAQDCDGDYGKQMHLFEITEITTHTYHEILVKENILPLELKMYRLGRHQINFTKFMNKTIIATDFKDKGTFFFERIRNTAKKLIRT